ncbi:unnamed protein product [Closterium sp. NIES-65]|nr:unnamed protein product [Closterium sp. NIES-65]
MALVSKVGGLLCVGILLLALALNPADAVSARSEDLNKGASCYPELKNFGDNPYFDKGMVAEIPVSKFDAGKACGTCYQVTCKNSKRCNKGASVTVRAMNNDGDGFTLNNPAWDKIVRDRSGSVEVEYRSVDCPTNGRGMAVMIERSSGPYYFALYVLGAARNAAVGKVELSTDGKQVDGHDEGRVGRAVGAALRQGRRGRGAQGERARDGGGHPAAGGAARRDSEQVERREDPASRVDAEDWHEDACS